VVLDLIGELDRGDAFGRLGLAGHLRQRAAARRALPIRGRKFVPNLDDRERRLTSRAMSGRRRSLRRRRWIACRRGGSLQQLRTSLLEILQDRQVELLGVGHTLEARDFRGQFQGLGNEALIFAIEEETDLTKRFKVLFLRQFDHALRI
jgi:hypothetical protein